MTNLATSVNGGCIYLHRIIIKDRSSTRHANYPLLLEDWQSLCVHVHIRVNVLTFGKKFDSIKFFERFNISFCV